MTSATDSIRDYLGYGGLDHQRRTMEQALAWDDEMLESTHDYIQWWFPLAEASAFNSHAPVTSLAEFEDLKSDARVREGVEKGMHRMLRFYGLRLNSMGVTEKTANWNRRSHNWAVTQTHNDLRITRILKSLCLLGHRTHAKAIHAALEQIIEKERGPSCEVPLQFWRAAMQ
jgi:hypothetical protein